MIYIGCTGFEEHQVIAGKKKQDYQNMLVNFQLLNLIQVFTLSRHNKQSKNGFEKHQQVFDLF